MSGVILEQSCQTLGSSFDNDNCLYSDGRTEWAELLRKVFYLSKGLQRSKKNCGGNVA